MVKRGNKEGLSFLTPFKWGAICNKAWRSGEVAWRKLGSHGTLPCDKVTNQKIKPNLIRSRHQVRLSSDTFELSLLETWVNTMC